MLAQHHRGIVFYCTLYEDRSTGFPPKHEQGMNRSSMRYFPVAIAVVMLAMSGCWSASGPEVTVYTAQDSEFAEPIFAGFTEHAGVAVRPKYDTESTKTVGLAEAILAERARPRCDIFWNNEVLNTLRLDKRGLLDVYRPAIAASYPAADRSPRGTWHGFAARARVLVVNANLLKPVERPHSVLALADPRWHGRSGIAKPLFGTTATHAACLFALWGNEKAKDFFLRLKANDVQIMSGNKQVALAVAAGRLAFGLTDTDDAITEQEKGAPLVIVYPDQETHEMGTLFIPNTLAILRGSPHPEAARRLIDYLLSPQVEIALAEGPSAQIPLGSQVRGKLRVETPQTVRPMAVDFSAAAEKWDVAAAFLRDLFAGG
jgi:iron(III) transport system substrate-binding protein